jgi:hypothetical protein
MMAQAGNHAAPAPRLYWKEGQITQQQVQAMTDVHGTPVPPQ